MGGYTGTIVSLYDLPQALLYFESIIPLNAAGAGVEEELRTGRPRPLPSLSEITSMKSVKEKVAFMLGRAYLGLEILPKPLRNNERFLTAFSVLYLNKMVADFLSFSRDEPRERALYAFLTSQKERFIDFLAEFNLLETPIDIPATFISQEEGKSADVALTLSSLNLIDASQASVEHIQEFRKERESMLKMRRFHLFAYERYAGKSKEFIEDDIATRLKDYEDERRKWGFKTVKGSISILQNSKTVAGTFIGALIAMHYGYEQAAIALPAAGAFLTLAGIAMDLRMQYFELREIMARNPVSYISYARDSLVGRR